MAGLIGTGDILMHPVKRKFQSYNLKPVVRGAVFRQKKNV